MRFALGLLSILIVGLAFQNCSPSFKEVQESQMALTDFRKLFNYPYDQAPSFYGEVQLVSNAASAKFNDVAYVGIVGQSEGATKNYAYELTVTNQSNFPVCPAMTGQLMAGQTSVMGSCISNVNSTKVKVTFKVTVDGVTKTFEKTY